MKTRLLILLSIVLVCGACSHRPGGVLSTRKMQAVLIDLHRVDGILQTVGYNYGHDYDVNVYYQQVLDKHQVTQAEFDSSLVWYTDHPIQFNRVYPKVLATLEKEQKYYQELSDARITSVSSGSAPRSVNTKNLIDFRRRVEYDLYREKINDDICPPMEIGYFIQKNVKKAPETQKNDSIICTGEKKAVPLQSLSTKGDAMLLRRPD